MVSKQRKQHAQEEAEETRRTILRVAQQLFMEYGYRAISTRQIADACGLTQPALYHHFKDKQELYVAMALEELSKTQVALERIARRSDTLEERLRRVALYLLSSTQHDHTLMLHDIRHELSPEARMTLSKAFQESIIAPIASLFQEGQLSGELRNSKQQGSDPSIAAFLFISMISTLLPRGHREFMQLNDGELVSLVTQIIFHGLARPAE
ncbi:MAG TPA: TetR/AcrR family transcriptional regulator [Ktedonobacteraceae bacterium]|jgi:AcrR family transcriptional regulator|nr:TetR/AcrR family transcriptional regulator [Ktedonobacteraceae bacterium]